LGSILLHISGTLLTLSDSFTSELGGLSTASSGCLSSQKNTTRYCKHIKVLLTFRCVLTRCGDEGSSLQCRGFW